MNDWSFSSLCRLAGVSKDTVNRLSPKTASIVLQETMPKSGSKPLQLLTEGNRIRSIHGASYTRLWNVDLLSMIQEFATDFQPPQQAVTGGTGLYCGEQDLFLFLIDPMGWVEIEGQSYAPGFFVYNSEVGRRSLAAKPSGFKPFSRKSSRVEFNRIFGVCSIITGDHAAFRMERALCRVTVVRSRC